MRSILILLTLATFIPRTIFALPAVQARSNTEGDATISLRLLQEAIRGDAVSWCEARIQVGSANVSWSEGDTVSAWVYEDDLTNDDLIWTTSFTVTSAEIASGLVDRTFDCSGFFDDDGGAGNSEVYAEVQVDKDACNTFCFNDSPRTANAVVQRVEDDAFEDDDASVDAFAVLPGVSFNRISNDAADWISFDLAGASQVDAIIVHNPAVGRLEATLLDASQIPIGVFQQDPDATVASEVLTAGIYFVVVGPAEPGNPNFYDFELVIGPVAPPVPTLPHWLYLTLVASLVVVGMFASSIHTVRPS